MMGLLALRFSDRLNRHRLDLHFLLQRLVDWTPKQPRRWNSVSSAPTFRIRNN